MLERLLEISGANLRTTLSRASDLIADALRADKVDAFLYDPERDSLAALGTSDQPLSALQRKHGLDVLPLSNGGRAVQIFTQGKTFVSGRLDRDPEELRGIKEALHVRSTLGVPLEIGGKRRGVILVASQQTEFFTEEDVRVTEGVTRWVGVVAHRAELMEEMARTAAEQGRRAVADELIATLAHDLRNYITPLEMRLQRLHRRAMREHREQDVRDLGLTQLGVTRLRTLISDMLDVARIDQGLIELQAQELDVVSALEEITTAFSTPEQPIALHAGEELVVPADPARLRQCMENLISNGLKHSPEGVPLDIFASKVQHPDGAWVRIEVVDAGAGIPPHLLDRIFERYVKGDAGSGGLGLGLYLAKQIALLHGGDLSVDQGPTRGARFILQLRACA
jgi:two-component system, OmpR family, sensor kinase